MDSGASHAEHLGAARGREMAHERGQLVVAEPVDVGGPVLELHAVPAPGREVDPLPSERLPSQPAREPSQPEAARHRSQADVDRHRAQVAVLPSKDDVAHARQPLSRQVDHLGVEHVAPQPQDASVTRRRRPQVALPHHHDLLAGWSPGDPLADEGSLYVQATAMTYAGIVMGRSAPAWRSAPAASRCSASDPFSNRFLLVAIVSEIALLLAMVSLPPPQDAFHMAPLDPRAWVLLAVWPFVVVAAEEARKALLRSRAVAAQRRSPVTHRARTARPESTSDA